MNDLLNGIVATDHIQVELSVRLGKARMTIAQLAALQKNDIVPLDKDITDGVEICIGDRVVAHGELVGDEANSDRLMLRITGATPEEA